MHFLKTFMSKINIKLPLLIFMLIGAFVSLNGQVSFNNAAHVGFAGVAGGGRSLTVPAGDDQLVLAFITSLNTASNPTVKYNNVTMTLAVSGSDVFGVANLKSWLYYLPFGSNVSATTANISVTGGNNIFFIGGASFNGIDQTNTLDNTFEEGGNDSGNTNITTHTHSFTTTSGDLLINYVGHNDPSHITGVGAGQTEFGFLATTFDAGSYRIATGNSHDKSFSMTNVGRVWNHLAAEFRQAVVAVPEMDITDASGDAIPDDADLAATSTTNSTDFGNVCAAGSTSSSFTYTITNSGTANLDFTGSPLVDITGTNPGDFSVTAQIGTDPLPHTTGNTTTFTVAFNPTATGVRSATISIDNDDANENPYDFVVKGTGIDPTITITATTTSVTEDGASNLVYQFARTCTAGVLVVNFSVSGTAIPGTDYAFNGHTSFSPGTKTGTITFADGNATVDLGVNPATDALIEGNETVVVTVENP